MIRKLILRALRRKSKTIPSEIQGPIPTYSGSEVLKK